MTDSLCNIATNSKISPGYKTDHSCVVLNINVTKSKREQGYFQINNSLLIDSHYRHSIKKAISDTLMFNREANANVRWELIKGSVRNETIRYATKKKHNDQKKEKDEIEEIYMLEQKVNTSNNSNEHIHSLSNKRLALDTLYDNKMNGLLFSIKGITC